MHESQLPRSCDRCYAIKERCIRSANSESCDRCARLNHECVLKRAVKRPGRRPKKTSATLSQRHDGVSQASTVEGPERNEPSSILDRIVAGLELSSVESSLLRQSILSDSFVEQFIIGPTFCSIHREYIAKQLNDFPSTLGHAFIASAMSWGDDSDVTSPEPSSSNSNSDYFERMYHHATEAVATLRSLEPSNVQEMCLCLALGATIMTFTLKLRVADARAICRQTLEIVKPIYTSDGTLENKTPDDLCFMSCLVLTDVAESLMFCDPPTLRYRVISEAQYVDRYVGISHSFLPLLFDVAELNFKMKAESGKPGGHPAAMILCEKLHQDLEQQVLKWMPDVPVGFTDNFTSIEVAHMLCQAEAIRNGARLVLHRLKYGFGTHDKVAEAISSNILGLLKTTTAATGSIPRCTDFPLIVACLELEGEGDRAHNLTSLSPISSYSSPFHDRTRAIFDATWEARRNHQSVYWYDLAAFIPDSSAGY